MRPSRPWRTQRLAVEATTGDIAAEMPRNAHPPRGFTLIEVLIAFLIAAMALAALVRVTTGAVHSTRLAARYDEAVARAGSHLAALSAASLIESDRQGDEGDGYHWHVRVAASGVVVPSRALSAIPPGVVTLYQVSVSISWTEGGHRRAVQLDGARLGPVA